MNTWIIALLILLIVIFVILFVLHGKSKSSESTNVANTEAAIEANNLPVFSFELLPSTTTIDENSLIEIKDKHLLARIDNVIPNAGKTLQNIKAAKGLEEVGELYQVIIPQGANLDHSRALEGAFRATFRDIPNSIQGQANLVKADKAVMASQAANVTNAVMNVGSMVVGQYYMSEINDKLEDITNSIKGISDFQTDEYKSKIMALGSQVKKISEYKSNTLDDEEIRNRTLNTLADLEEKTIELLGQANLKLERYKSVDIDYKTYEEQTKEAEIWYQYQQILSNILFEIDSLTYTLYLGKEPKEKCFKLFLEYQKLSENTLSKLNKWHSKVADKLQIDISSGRIRKKVFRWLSTKIDNISEWDYSYRQMNDDMVSMIENQSSGENARYTEKNDLFQEDVRLIKKDGKVYYLPYNSQD